MSLYDYHISKETGQNDYPFYAIIMAAIRKADSDNFERLKTAWPEIVKEFQARYNAPLGILPEDDADPERVMGWLSQRAEEEKY